MSVSPLVMTCGFSKFRYAIADASGRQRGELRLKTLPKDPITIEFEGARYRIDYQVTSNRFITNDFCFTLVGNDGPMVSAQKISGRKDFDMVLNGVGYRLTNRSSLFSLAYALTDHTGHTIGTLSETTGFSLWRRRFRIDLPESISGPAGVFLFFLVVNLRYR